MEIKQLITERITSERNQERNKIFSGTKWKWKPTESNICVTLKEFGEKIKSTQ